ncbi:MAG: hypothetical protein NVSMB48_00330 [Marmoricola sp.]
MSTVYDAYRRDRAGWFLGISGTRAATLAITAIPILIALSRGALLDLLMFTAAWVVIAVLTLVTVHGRTTFGWFTALAAFTIGSLTSSTTFRSRAARGVVVDPNRPDLPGRMTAIEIHDGPPTGPRQVRIAIIQDHAAKTWAVTAAVTHPGIGMAEETERSIYATGLTELIEQASRGELIEEIQLLVRTVPDDGAERRLWTTRHHQPGAPFSTQVNTDLAAWLTQASVRTEAFITLVVTERNISKPARESGGGITGRARVLYSLMGEAEGQLRASIGARSVSWLTSPELAAVCRTGFAPGDRAAIVQALADQTRDPRVNADVPWGNAGPAGAQPSGRWFAHDAWWSISSTITLPERGAVMGALAPVLMPGEPGERRSFMVCLPISTARRAARASASAEWKNDMGQGIRERIKRRASTKTTNDEARTRAFEAKIATGSALIRPYAVATVTVPQTESIVDYGRRLDSAIRRAGFAPLRLDLSHDIGMCAATIPVGISLAKSSGTALAALFEGGRS